MGFPGISLENVLLPMLCWLLRRRVQPESFNSGGTLQKPTTQLGELGSGVFFFLQIWLGVVKPFSGWWFKDIFLIFIIFSSLKLGKWSQFVEHIFSDGWLNIPNRSVFDTPFFPSFAFFVVAGFSLRFWGSWAKVRETQIATWLSCC